jgi:hypothetical protein
MSQCTFLLDNLVYFVSDHAVALILDDMEQQAAAVGVGTATRTMA